MFITLYSWNSCMVCFVVEEVKCFIPSPLYRKQNRAYCIQDIQICFPSQSMYMVTCSSDMLSSKSLMYHGGLIPNAIWNSSLSCIKKIIFSYLRLPIRCLRDPFFFAFRTFKQVVSSITACSIFNFFNNMIAELCFNL